MPWLIVSCCDSARSTASLASIPQTARMAGSPVRALATPEGRRTATFADAEPASAASASQPLFADSPRLDDALAVTQPMIAARPVTPSLQEWLSFQ
jgi:hypothetical protein